MFQQFGPAEIEYEVVAFEVVDDDTLDIKLSVTRQDPSQEAVCIVRARSRDGSETGRREILVPASVRLQLQRSGLLARTLITMPLRCDFRV